MGERVVHVLQTHHVQLRVPDAVLFGKQEGEKLLRKKQKCVNDAEEPELWFSFTRISHSVPADIQLRLTRAAPQHTNYLSQGA